MSKRATQAELRRQWHANERAERAARERTRHPVALQVVCEVPPLIPGLRAKTLYLKARPGVLFNGMELTPELRAARRARRAAERAGQKPLFEGEEL